jgi:hypothetical protein
MGIGSGLPLRAYAFLHGAAFLGELRGFGGVDRAESGAVASPLIIGATIVAAILS